MYFFPFTLETNFTPKFSSTSWEVPSKIAHVDSVQIRIEVSITNYIIHSLRSYIFQAISVIHIANKLSLKIVTAYDFSDDSYKQLSLSCEKMYSGKTDEIH